MIKVPSFLIFYHFFQNFGFECYMSLIMNMKKSDTFTFQVWL